MTRTLKRSIFQQLVSTAMSKGKEKTPSAFDKFPLLSATQRLASARVWIRKHDHVHH